MVLVLVCKGYVNAFSFLYAGISFTRVVINN